jgi:sugar O-acyltransferase (sialic acid O-acetyltransferase NeuD family)
LTSTPSTGPEPAAPEPIFVYGAGGHGRAVAEVVRRQGRFRIAAVVDDRPQPEEALGAPFAGGREALPGLAERGIRKGFVAIGDNAGREAAMALVQAAGFGLVTVVDPSAVVAGDADVDVGVALMPFSLVGANAAVGRGAILNTSATIDHDCDVREFAHISVGVHLTGGCVIGARAFIGIGAVVGRPVTIGDETVVGAGATVVSDLPARVVAVGTPARVVRPVAGDPLAAAADSLA